MFMAAFTVVYVYLYGCALHLKELACKIHLAVLRLRLCRQWF
jgi:hypothetical protein